MAERKESRGKKKEWRKEERARIEWKRGKKVEGRRESGGKKRERG